MVSHDFSYYLTLLQIFISCNFLSAQSQNDNIEDRILIHQDSVIHSFTNGNTVQWNCVDEKLTGKCIKYHNDQWFYFTALESPVQYINISSQNCRDLWGVQLVVLEGVPCETETYNIKTCVSLASQDDFFVELENLEPGKEYLLNVDGYLHDFCSFEMELSLTPLGLPAVQKIQLDASDYVQNDTLKYFWTTPDSLLGTITSYNLHRRKSNEFKFTFLKNFPTKKDAFGEVKKEFQYREILEREHTPWAYKLVAETSGESFIADEFSAREYRRSPEKMHYRIPVEIAFMEKAELSLKLVDYLMGVVLEEKTINYLPGDYKPVYFDVGEYIELGVKRFHLEIKNLDTNELFRVEYEYSKEDGLKEVR